MKKYYGRFGELDLDQLTAVQKQALSKRGFKFPEKSKIIAKDKHPEQRTKKK